MLGRDGVAGLICLGGSLWLLALTRGLPQPALVPIGPGFYPRIVLTIMAALSGILVVMDILPRLSRRSRAGLAGAVSQPAAARPAGDAPSRNYRLVAVTFAIFAAYVAVLPALGYRVGTFLFVAALQGALEPPHGRRWLRLVAVAGATAFLTHLVFEGYLSVLLPRGRFTGL